jgi:hypothetical protein
MRKLGLKILKATIDFGQLQTLIMAESPHLFKLH